MGIILIHHTIRKSFYLLIFKLSSSLFLFFKYSFSRLEISFEAISLIRVCMCIWKNECLLFLRKKNDVLFHLFSHSRYIKAKHCVVISSFLLSYLIKGKEQVELGYVALQRATFPQQDMWWWRVSSLKSRLSELKFWLYTSPCVMWACCLASLSFRALICKTVWALHCLC